MKFHEIEIGTTFLDESNDMYIKAQEIYIRAPRTSGAHWEEANAIAIEHKSWKSGTATFIPYSAEVKPIQFLARSAKLYEGDGNDK
jgi:hypothetical protein